MKGGLDLMRGNLVQDICTFVPSKAGLAKEVVFHKGGLSKEVLLYAWLNYHSLTTLPFPIYTYNVHAFLYKITL